MRPNFTLTYGLGYMITMPGFELSGHQSKVVDDAGYQIDARRLPWPAAKSSSRRTGLRSDPRVCDNTKCLWPLSSILSKPSTAGSARGLPRRGIRVLATASSPRFSVTTRQSSAAATAGSTAGWTAVTMVMAPLLGTGMGQAVACVGASRSGQCLGASGVDPTTAFRIGTDGMTAPLPTVSQILPQPYFPGVGSNAAAGDGSSLDSRYKPTGPISSP